MSRVAVIVRTDGWGRAVRRVVDTICSGAADVEIILLDDGSPDAALRRTMDDLERRHGARRVGVPRGGSLAAWRNAGVEATRAAWVAFVDPSWHPSASWIDRAAAAMNEGGPRAIVTSAVRRTDAAGRETVVVPEGTLSELLGDPEALHPCTMFHRDLWTELGGFDESLPGLDLADFWVRAISSGCSVLVIDEPLVEHRPAETRHYRRDLLRRGHIPALTALFRKHRSLFESDPASVLAAREGALYDLSGTYASITERRARAVAEVEALRREIAELTATLRGHGRDRVEWGDLRRTTPISPEWGMDRGKPVDRHYIESFLSRYSDDVRGEVLEVQEADYTRELGGDRVTRSDVVDLDPTNPRATFVADLRQMEAVPDASYDCFILTQTVHVIDDMAAVIREAHRILRPGGVLLATFPCLSRVCLEYGEDGDFWRLTEAGVRNLLESSFPVDSVTTKCYGNVLTATAFLHGLACEEVRDEEFEPYDPYHPVLIGARATKPATPKGGAPAIRRSADERAGTVLAYHRVAEASPDVHGLCVSPDEFRRQMQALVENARPMPLVDLVKGAREGALEPGSVAVTFDDGYLDVLEVASPILLELGIPATFFLVSEALECEMSYWWDALELVFLSSVGIPDEIDIEVHGTVHRRPTRTPDERRAAHDALYPDLQRCAPAQRDHALRALALWSGIELRPRGSQRPLLAAEARDLASRPGHSIGAHGVHHLALSSQPYETQQREIMEARTALESVVGVRVRSFAYPYGDLCGTAVDLVTAAGYDVAVTCEESRVDTRVNAHRVPRVDGRAWWPTR